MSSPTRLDAIVTQNSLLRQLFRQAGAHRQLDRQLKDLLEEPLRSHVRVGVMRENSLVLVADSPAWAAKLRYQVPSLHSRIASHSAFPDIQTIRVKTAHSGTPPQRGADPPQRPLSKAAAEDVRNQARDLEDPVLREAVLRLARHRGD